jgi:hypothetical protein
MRLKGNPEISSKKPRRKSCQLPRSPVALQRLLRPLFQAAMGQACTARRIYANKARTKSRRLALEVKS